MPLIALFLTTCLLIGVECNSSPRFVLNGDSEIILKLKESPETPVGKIIYTIRGEDADDDSLSFGVEGPVANDLLEIRKTGKFSADIILKKELDREAQDSHTIYLTLTDGKLGHGNFIKHAMLILVRDINDNEPIFKPFQSTISIKENTYPSVVATVEATDRDEGPFGQVIYHLEDTDDIRQKFNIKTMGGKGVISLASSLDYEEKYLYQLRVLAIDQAFNGRKNTATAAILVRVEDKEDQPPEFAFAPPVTRIPENLPVGSTVLKVTAIDGDRGINNAINYRIANRQYTPFQINSASGEVTIKQSLDREKTDNRNGAYILEIMAEEITSVINSTPRVVTEITIILTDINDETPTFKSSLYETEIIENAQVNVPVDIIGSSIPEVYDHDQGKNGTFNLYLLGDNSVFEVTPAIVVNEARFLIRVKNPSILDYEEIKQMRFKIVAEETVSDSPKKSMVDVVVNIKDANDNIPQFESQQISVTIPENSPINTRVAWIQATDVDSGVFGTEGIRYMNIKGQIADILDLNSNTGVITLKKNSLGILDREKTSEYYLSVEVQDNNGLGNRNTVQVHVILEDENDNAPVFLQPKYEARINENQPKFDTPVIIKARDEDLNGTKNHEVRYKIISGDPDKNFTIDSVSGILQPVYPIDFEKTGNGNEDISKLELVVRAYDLGTPSLFNDVLVNIYVKDMNDHAPKFQRQYYTKAIPENSVGGSKVIQVLAFDGDKSSTNNRIVYRIQNGAFDKFVIDANTGAISVADRANLDPDLTLPRKTNYVLDVVALDAGIGQQQKKSSVIVNITITDINNKPPRLAAMKTIEILENVKHGYFVTQIQADDPDVKAILRYSIDYEESEAVSDDGSIVNKAINNIVSSFEIDPIDGMVRVTRELDREIAETVKLIIRVEDKGSVTGKQIAAGSLIIKLIDVNDNAPIFREDSYRSAVRENAKTNLNILTVTADDADKDKSVTYRIDARGKPFELLKINKKTGIISVKEKIDREINSWLNFTVIATDAGKPPKSGYVEVFLQVLDENDNNPVFVSGGRDVIVAEDATIGQEVATIRAVDGDIGEYGKITYLLDSKSSKGKFTIDRETGVITVAEELDREEKDSYNLIVQAWDNYQYGFTTGESRNAFKQIFVVVRDVNDEAPYFITQDGCATITEYHNQNDPIILVKANDKDDVQTGNGQLTFSLINENSGLFSIVSIDMKNAQIVAKTPLIGKFGNYSLNVKAADRGHPQLQSNHKYDICVLDVNDNAPVFVSPPKNITIRIPENATIGTTVVKVKATDDDIGKNGAVRYRFKQLLDRHWQTFEIDEISGIMKLAQPLDREVQANYRVRVEALDLGQPTLLSDLDLNIFVTNINDFAPQFVVDTFVVHFKENERPGLTKRKLVSTVDKDEDDIDEKKIIPCYFIVGGEGIDKFYLDSFTHELSVTQELDREQKSSYKLIIRATDDCFSIPPSVSRFDPNDDTLLHLNVIVDDLNDNAPAFSKKIFTGGITTDTDFGTIFMNVRAIDPDDNLNGNVSYYLVGQVRSTLSTQLANLRGQPFLVNKKSGEVSINFDPQPGMKGYFDFVVKANDTFGLEDSAQVYIYLLRQDQRVKFILRLNPSELREKLEQFRNVLENITGAIVNVDEYKFHENHDGSVDKTKSDLYLHFVQREDNSIMDVNTVLSLIDQNTEFLVELFKEFNVLDSMAAEPAALQSDEIEFVKISLIGLCIFLIILLLLIVAICLNQRNRYKRQLKAATATAFGSHDSGLNRVDVPNTNQHSVEGSNPIWMQGYDNEGWVKDDETLSQASLGNNSLDENVIDEIAQAKRKNVKLIRKSRAPAPAPPSRNTETSSISDENNDQHHLMNDDKINKNQNDLNRTYKNNLIYETSKKITNPLILKVETSEL